MSGGSFLGGGTIRAKGGSAAATSGDGGGGRIAVTGFNSTGFTGTIPRGCGRQHRVHQRHRAAALGGADDGAAHHRRRQRQEPAVHRLVGQLRLADCAQQGVGAPHGAGVGDDIAVTTGTLQIDPGVSISTDAFTLLGTGSALVNEGTLLVPSFTGWSFGSGVTVTNRGELVIGSGALELATGVTLVEDGNLRGAGKPADTLQTLHGFSPARC